MLEGLYQSEYKNYFRDQERFCHYLLFKEGGSVYYVSGKMNYEEAFSLLTRSTKSISGEVLSRSNGVSVKVRWLVSGKKALPDGSNIHEANLMVVADKDKIEVSNLDKNDYKEFAGIYTKVEINENA